MFALTNSDNFYSFIPTKSHDGLAENAAKTAIHNFEWTYTTLFLFNSSILTGVETFLKLYKKSNIIGKGKFYPPFAQNTKQYILFGTDLLNIEHMLDWMRFHQFDNTGKYIVTCQSQDCNENEAVNIFWSHKITNIVFIKYDDGGEVAGYTYYQPDENCRHSKPMKTKICTIADTSCYGLFTEKVKNLRGCEIIVSTFIQVPYMNISDGKPKGADGDLLLLIGERLNATLKVITPRVGDGWGKRERDGTWTGSLRDLIDDTANFSMTSAALTLSRFSYFQMSLEYYTCTVAWITHPAQTKPASLKLFYPFQTLSQIVLVISYIFVGLCAWFVNSQYWPFYKNINYSSKPKDNVLFYSWMICMGLPSSKFPTKPLFMYVAFFWIWYCFLIRTLYQVCLISSLQGNFYYDEINSIEEAFLSNYSFGGGLALKDYYIDYPLVYDNWKTVDILDIVPTLINLSGSSRDFVLAMNLETAKSIIQRRRLFVHILPQKVINSPTVIFFKKFSPLASSVSIILRRLVEGGFTDKIYKKYASKNERQDGVRTPITLEHYTGCYVILGFGWTISIVCFIIELFYSKSQKHKRICKTLEYSQVA